MRFPSWPDFKNGLNRFEGKITEFKKEHPDWDRMINGLITFLPPPFDSLADKIYNSFDGTGDEKANAVLSYLRHLESLGEKHYNQIVLQLDNLLNKIDDVKQITAKESTLQNIQEILISSGNITLQKLDLLRNETQLITYKLDKIQSDIAKPIEELGEAFGYFKEEDWGDWRFRSAFLERCEEVELNEKLIKMIIAIALEDYHWINRKNATNLLGRNLEKFSQIKETLQTIANNDEDWRIRDDASNWIKGTSTKEQLRGQSTKKQDKQIGSKLFNMKKES